MKEVKAYVHRSRAADVIEALKNSSKWGGAAGDAAHNLAVYLVRGLVPTSIPEERRYSTDLGDEVVNEYKLELICEASEVGDIVRIIAAAAQTGGRHTGWITVSDLEQTMRIS